MAWARYLAGPGGHPEPSLSLPDFGDEGWAFLVPPYATNLARRIEVVALPPGVRRRISVWAALVLAAARQRQGPWVEVRLEPGEWALVRRRAPWFVTVTDSFRWLTPHGFPEGSVPPLVHRWRASSVQSYRVENERTLTRFSKET